MLQQASAFAEMVDKLRYKSDEELKYLYMMFFQKELEAEWADITSENNMDNVSEELIISTILSNRYKDHV
ncbi:hypothetical protein [Niabella ginsengisoli]|uniref:Uncharacterized protein n=1 Tax=Niabella ginsengisoli TaxID=522298 RepID=A0ABS9SQ12_9BACT|nr:hypothetical protein [Niabella ginsengisoli]MCH5600444.1 hypothetical protein [Niabella ginsengisoli]